MEQYVCHILTSFSALPDKIFERDNQKDITGHNLCRSENETAQSNNSKQGRGWDCQV